MSDQRTAEDAAKWFVGQEVWLVVPGNYGIKREPRRVTIEKVGRKYVTIGRDRFFIDTGRRFAGDYSTSTFIETDNMRTERLYADRLTRTLRDAGIDVRHGFRYSNQQIEGVLAALGVKIEDEVTDV